MESFNLNKKSHWSLSVEALPETKDKPAQLTPPPLEHWKPNLNRYTCRILQIRQPWKHFKSLLLYLSKEYRTSFDFWGLEPELFICETVKRMYFWIRETQWGPQDHTPTEPTASFYTKLSKSLHSKRIGRMIGGLRGSDAESALTQAQWPLGNGGTQELLGERLFAVD
jgi:hypothetical protein